MTDRPRKEFMRNIGIRRLLETALAKAAMAFVPRMTRQGVLRWARALGGFAYFFAGHLRRVGHANLDLAFRPSLNPEEKRRILQASFRNFALVMLDTFWFSRDTIARLREWVRFDAGFDAWMRTKSQICITAHLGNWEVLGMALVQRGYPLLSVAAPLENPDVDKLFNEMRVVTGQQVLPKQGVLRALLKQLKSGGKVALLLDQNTKPDEGGVFVDFFGLPVPVSSAAAALAQRTGAEVLVGACLPRPDGTYFVPNPDRVVAPAEAADTTPLMLTQAIALMTERWIRTHPQAWLWMYKRWKYVAPGRRREEYPFYAKTAFASPAADTEAKSGVNPPR
jgi:lauroyl/myristoyl acyltransferase